MEVVGIVLSILAIAQSVGLWLLSRIWAEIKCLREWREKDRDNTAAMDKRLTKLETEHKLYYGDNRALQPGG